MVCIIECGFDIGKWLNADTGVPVTYPDYVARHLDLLFGFAEGEDGFIAFRAVPEGGNTGDTIERWFSPGDLTTTSEAIHDLCAQAAQAGRMACILPGLVGEYGKKSANDVVAVGALLIDFDSGDIEGKLQKAREALGAPSMVVQSGGVLEDGTNKVHAYWRLSELARGADVDRVYRLNHAAALAFGGDACFRNKSQIVRLAGSVHQKSAPVGVYIIEDEGHEYELDDLAERIEALSPTPTGKGNLSEIGLNFANVPPRTDRAEVFSRVTHAGAVDEVTRYEDLTQAIGVALRLVREGVLSSVEQAWDMVRWKNATQIVPPWGENELQREFIALHRLDLANHGPVVTPEQKKEQAKARFTFLSPADLAELEPPEWMVPDFIPQRGVTCLYGAPGRGKTFVMLDMALSLAHGLPWLGRECKPARVVYVAAEGKTGIGNRVTVWHQSKRLDLGAGNFRLLPTVLSMIDKDDVAALIEAIEGLGGADLIVIDTLSKTLGGGEENSNTDLGQYIANCERLREAFDGQVIFVHHPGKEESKGPRGGAVITGNVDTQIVLRRTSGTDRIRMHVEKQKDAEDGQNIELRLVPVTGHHVRTGEVLTSCIVKPEAGDSAKMGPVQKQINSYLNGKPPADAATIAEAMGKPVKDIRKAINSLIERGFVTEEDGLYSAA